MGSILLFKLLEILFFVSSFIFFLSFYNLSVINHCMANKTVVMHFIDLFCYNHLPSMKSLTCFFFIFQIFFNLQKLLGKLVNVGGESEDNLTWSLLKSTKTDCCSSNSTDIDALTENCSKLNVALGVMHECFEPVKDAHTRRDLVEDILFNRR